MKRYIWSTDRLVAMIVGPVLKLEEIEGFIDNDVNKTGFMGKRVLRPSEMKGSDYDAIIVANLFSREIYEQSCELGLDVSKFIFTFSNCSITDMNKDYSFVAEVLGKDYADVIRKRHIIVRKAEAFGDSALRTVLLRVRGILIPIT